MTATPAESDGDLRARTLWTLLRAEAGAGVLGLGIFIACIAIAAFMLAAIWMLGSGLADALKRNGYAILGGELAITVVNRPLDDSLIEKLAALPATQSISRVVEVRTTAHAGGQRAPVELKAVDGLYPLFGAVALSPAIALDEALTTRSGVPGAVVEASLQSRLPVEPGSTIRIGERDFEVRAVLEHEPDRLSSGRFLVGPRVTIGADQMASTGLLTLGALADFRYRMALHDNADPAAALAAVRALEPARGWELETPEDAGDRVRRTIGRTTTFLGLAGMVALSIGLAGAWAAATFWIGRRARTIALYRLSGATPALVTALHGAIVALAAAIGLSIGFALAAVVAATLMEVIAARLHLAWQAADLAVPGLGAIATLAIGVLGASTAALSAAARTPPGHAMRSGDAGLSPHPAHVLIGLAAVLCALAIAVIGLPMPGLAAVAAFGLAGAAGLLALCGWSLARLAARLRPRGFVALLVVQGLSQPGATAMKALTIGIGIAGVSAVLTAQNSLDRALQAEIPDKVPDIVLIDVQPDQVTRLRERIEADPALGGLQADPFMRASILEVNGVPAEQALVRRDKRWVIEGDRSFSWSAAPTQSALVAGQWWAEDYTGPPLVAPEEDVAQAFDLKVGDRIAYSVLGRVFVSEVVGIRKEYHRTFRPEYLMLASAEPFRRAPHSWIMTLQGDTDEATERMIRDAAAIAPNVTAIDVRQIVAQVHQLIGGAALGTLAIAALLLLAGALCLGAVVAADVDARRREALAYALVGASRREVALARLAEALALGTIAALIGGAAGIAGGRWLAESAFHVTWEPGLLPFVLPAILGGVAAISAGAAGGLSALPRGPGQLARHLAG